MREFDSGRAMLRGMICAHQNDTFQKVSRTSFMNHLRNALVSPLIGMSAPAMSQFETPAAQAVVAVIALPK